MWVKVGRFHSYSVISLVRNTAEYSKFVFRKETTKVIITQIFMYFIRIPNVNYLHAATTSELLPTVFFPSESFVLF